jgi:hypothetical protein
MDEKKKKWSQKEDVTNNVLRPEFGNHRFESWPSIIQTEISSSVLNNARMVNQGKIVPGPRHKSLYGSGGNIVNLAFQCIITEDIWEQGGKKNIFTQERKQIELWRKS